MSRQAGKISIIATIILLIIGSFSISFISIIPDFEEETSNAVRLIIGIAFWVGILGAIIASAVTAVALKKEYKRLVASGEMKKQRLPGIFSFGKEANNLCIYALILFGLIMIVTDIIFEYVPQAAMFPLISITILAFSLHCVMDGKYYKAYKLVKESENNE